MTSQERGALIRNQQDLVPPNWFQSQFDAKAWLGTNFWVFYHQTCFLVPNRMIQSTNFLLGQSRWLLRTTFSPLCGSTTAAILGTRWTPLLKSLSLFEFFPFSSAHVYKVVLQLFRWHYETEHFGLKANTMMWGRTLIPHNIIKTTSML